MKSDIQHLMSTSLITVSVDDNLIEATRLMKEHRVRHLPVVDQQKAIVGILSSKDLPPFAELKNLNVEFYMSSPAIFINHKTSLKAAIYKMLEQKISSILVADDQNCAIGIVTSDDLLWYLVEILEKESKESKSFLSQILDLPTLGQVAHQISNAGL